MYINKIKLSNFRNYKEQEITLGKGINIFYGDNAQGKTNLIEAIFLCSMGKSFRSKKDKELIKFDELTTTVKIDYERQDRSGNIKAIIGEKKEFFINGVKQTKVSNLVGKINVVIFSPDDIDIIKEGPQKRRKFLDMMISSLKPNYIHLLNNYNRVLEQRNTYLKQIVKEGKSETLLDILDEQLAELSYQIFEYRNHYIEKFATIIQQTHDMMTKKTKNAEIIKIKYISNSQEKQGFVANLKKSRKIDLARGYTSTGVHRDDFLIYINKKIVSIYGSQGQQRTTTLTLKLCELRIVTDEIGETPILLLDDFMSELDENRRQSFLENLKDSQVIITCTDKIAIKKEHIKSFYVENGNVQQEIKE